jgi:hypothetical protein
MNFQLAAIGQHVYRAVTIRPQDSHTSSLQAL